MNKDIVDHFVQVHEEISHGKRATQKYESFALSRYACGKSIQKITQERVKLKKNKDEQ